MFDLIHERMLVILASMSGALIVGSAVRFVALRGAEPDIASKRLASLRTWWVLALLLSGALLLGTVGLMLLLMLAGGLGLREFTRICGLERTDPVAAGLAWLMIPVHYALVLWGPEELSLLLLPLGFPLFLGGWKAASGRTADFVRSTAVLSFGVLLLVYAPSFALRLCSLPDALNQTAGPAGWLLFLLILTEMNDISQALVGRRLGAHKITPRVSPKKSWEGFAGGVVVTCLLAVLLAPWLTALANGDGSASFLLPVLAGLLIAVAGFLGDINMSAVKRDVGVKDGSTLLAGQGGVIDRIDSLTFTAPVFYWFVRCALEA